jgi:hypothetical protein
MEDFTFVNHGSLWLCRPNNDEAREHLREHVDAEAQWFAGAVAVEPRYVTDLAMNLQDAGFGVVSL